MTAGHPDGPWKRMIWVCAAAFAVVGFHYFGTYGIVGMGTLGAVIGMLTGAVVWPGEEP